MKATLHRVLLALPRLVWAVSEAPPTPASVGLPNPHRSYWIPGSYAPALSEKRNSFLRLLKNKGFQEERRTKIGLYAISSSTTLESNKSLQRTVFPLERMDVGLALCGVEELGQMREHWHG